jgi:membrane protease subunit HflC
MKLGIAGGVLIVLAVIAAIVGYSSLFTVYQTRLALVVRLGQPVRVVTEPGLNFKVPLIDSVIYVDKRILDLENPAQEVIGSRPCSMPRCAGCSANRRSPTWSRTSAPA